MKALVLGLCLASVSAAANAKCVVEILNQGGDPLGYIYQESDCRTAMNKCKAQLPRVNVSGAKCEITLDIPGQQPKSKDGVTIINL